jgi:hypothetical protein
LAGDLIGKDYLRVNSALNGVNRRLDDKSEPNLLKIKKMGEQWWDKFGEDTVKLLTS